MGFLKKKAALLWASIHTNTDKKKQDNAVENQEKWFHRLITEAAATDFGKDFNFSEIKTIKDYQNTISVTDYEKIKPYIEKIKEGEKDVLWTGAPLYLAKTSGTTSGIKYIPITKESMPFHIQGARNALLDYIYKKNNADFVEGKMIFLQGSPVLEEINELKIGRLSGISAHFVPKYLQKNRLPSWETNCIEDWETKINEIIKETVHQNMTLISGIPPWLVMYFEKLTSITGESVGNIFPNLQLLVTGGVNYKPYEEKINELMGRKIDVVQTYPASEGFIGYQNDIDTDDLLLMTDHGIFYEFILVEELAKHNPPRLTLEEVELNIDYAIILTTNAGLWSYEIGDTIRFTSLDPYKIIVSGRIKHFTSAFGEHVIAYEVEEAIKEVVELSDIIIREFTLAPQTDPEEGLPYHEWFIEFEKYPDNLQNFELQLDNALRERNAYYDDLITGKVLQPLKVTLVQKNGFTNYMRDIGKLGGQNKLPRLSNDRNIADKLYKYIISKQ